MRRININPVSTSSPLTAEQVKNNSGGFGWQVKPIDQLRRFLVLGSSGPTYYVSEKSLTQTNLDAVEQLIKSDGVSMVSEILLFALENRTPKKEASLCALAMAAVKGDLETRRAAYAALPTVAKTPTDLFSFIDYSEKLSAPRKGWGRARRNAVAKWYESKSTRDLVYHVTKYKQRNGWSNRDVLRLCHVKTTNHEHNLIYRLVTKGTLAYTADEVKDHEAFDRLMACDEIQHCKDDVPKAVELIRKHHLVHEHVPTELQGKAEIWEALLPEMPLTALIRNLGRMTHLGLLTVNSEATRKAIQKLSNEEALKKAHIHPFNVLTALHQYSNGGEGGKGKLRWSPNPQITSLLDETYYAAFHAVEPADKRYMLGVDVSASMTYTKVTGSEVLNCNMAAAALGMVLLRTEPMSYLLGFDHGIRDLGVSSSDRMDSVLKKISNINGGGTDCSLAMTYAMQKNIPVDIFVVLTDNENNPGRLPPTVALEQYRQKTGIDARLAVISLNANAYTIADPNDRGMLDLVGFDSASPRILRDFSKGLF